MSLSEEDMRHFEMKNLIDLNWVCSIITRVIRLLTAIGLLKSSVLCSCGQQMRIKKGSEGRHPLDEDYCFVCRHCGADKTLRTDSIFIGQRIKI